MRDEVSEFSEEEFVEGLEVESDVTGGFLQC